MVAFVGNVHLSDRALVVIRRCCYNVSDIGSLAVQSRRTISSGLCFVDGHMSSRFDIR